MIACASTSSCTSRRKYVRYVSIIKFLQTYLQSTSICRLRLFYALVKRRIWTNSGWKDNSCKLPASQISLSKVTLNSQCFINRYDAICIGAEAGQAVEFFTEAEAYQFFVMQLFSKPIASYGSIWHLSQQIWSWRAVWKTWNWLEDDCNDNIIDTNGTNEGRVLAPSCPCQRGIRICARLSGLNTCMICSVCSMEARTGMLPSGSWCIASHKLLKGFAVSQCLSENAAIWTCIRRNARKVFTCSMICTNQYVV